MKRRSCKERLKIPLEGNPETKFYTKNGLKIAQGYVRVVIGGRGPYIEFEDSHIIKENIHIPKHAEYKITQSLPYYHEYRSNDECFVKLYYQKMEVSYADYKIGKWYIDPEKVKTDYIEELMLPPYPEPEEPEIAEKQPTLFDA